MWPSYLEALADKYEIVEDLTLHKGQGHKTYLAFFASKGECFRVILKELDEKRTGLYKAMSCMWNLYSANVLCVHELPAGSLTEEPVSIAAIEYAGDISLAEYIKQNGILPEETALSICTQLCRALSKMHSSGIVHRDIKPENIIVSDPVGFKIKLIDFGSATIVSEKRAFSEHHPQPAFRGDTTVVGTFGYQAPESLMERTTSRSDIYSIGCVLNFMLTGSDPGIIRYHGNPEIRYILRHCMNGDPSMRFRNVSGLEKSCRHALKTVFPDNIPIIRSIPGYRSHTQWKAAVASCYYCLMAYELIVLLNKYPIHNFIATAFFWFLIPLFVFGSPGYVCEFLPDRIIRNNMLFNVLRAGIFLVCLFVPLTLY